MPEKEPQITFTDRRKISSEGEIRPEAAAQAEAERREAASRQVTPKPAQSSEQPPRPSQSDVKKADPGPDRVADRGEEPLRDRDMTEPMPPEGPTAQETAESHAAYRETTQQLDELLRSKAPESANLGPVSFDHLVQSMYMTAMMGLGAGTRPGEKPRVDLMGARQTIDLLGVLQEKTKGNLTSDEQRLLESALFELRMMFLEITNAIARNASAPKK
jgi:Domain of unknown function (DUF1844)